MVQPSVSGLPRTPSDKVERWDMPSHHNWTIVWKTVSDSGESHRIWKLDQSDYAADLKGASLFSQLEAMSFLHPGILPCWNHSTQPCSYTYCGFSICHLAPEPPRDLTIVWENSTFGLKSPSSPRQQCLMAGGIGPFYFRERAFPNSRDRTME